MNNAPYIGGTSEFRVLEDTPFVLNLTVSDVDAAHRLRGSSHPVRNNCCLCFKFNLLAAGRRCGGENSNEIFAWNLSLFKAS